jgi:hypothetical protein
VCVPEREREREREREGAVVLVGKLQSVRELLPRT